MTTNPNIVTNVEVLGIKKIHMKVRRIWSQVSEDFEDELIEDILVEVPKIIANVEGEQPSRSLMYPYLGGQDLYMECSQTEEENFKTLKEINLQKLKKFH